MPELGAFHPIVVHFAIALLFVGVPLRILSLFGKWQFPGPAALLLILVGTAASMVAVKSGIDAHGPAERVPGARPAVVEHEELGEKTRNIFLAVAAMELLALALRKQRYGRAFLFGSAAIGAVGLFFMYETGEHGGELVYSYAGGVGTRTGEEEDVGRLLRAGLYHQAMQDREAGRAEAAARLIDEMAQRSPSDPDVLLLSAQSTLQDRNDPEGALAQLERIPGASEGPMRLRVAYIRADALVAMGDRAGALALLEGLQQEFPTSTQLQRRIEALQN
ncbi:MAG: DUF2231 domain-containing protein [Gemmatimonadota bacterium]